jgi:hypothetical protein
MSKLVKDWFNRRAEDAYTFADDSKRFFSWDKGRSSYSSFFVRNDDSLKTAAKMIGSMYRVIGVPKTFKYANNLEESSSSHPVVQVPLGMLRDEKGNYLDKDSELLDAFYGAAIQNAALATMQTTSEYAMTVRARDAKKATLRDLLFSVLNTERIDKKLADRLPGYLKFVQKFKDHRHDYATPLKEDAHPQKRLTDLIIKMLRYPADLSETDLEEFEKPVQSIERLLKKHGGIPATADECSSMATSLSNIILKYEEDEEPPPPSEGSDDESESGDESSEGGTPPLSSSKAPKMSKSELDDFAKKMMKELINPDEGECSTTAFEKEFEEFTDDMRDDHTMRMDQNWDNEGLVEDSVVVFTNATSDKNNYKKTLSKIDITKAAVLQKLFQRKSKDQAFVMKSMRSGRLDTNKIAEAVQNVPTIYERIGHIRTNKICVGVLIDESGSMGGSKIEKARQAAVFINEVFRKMPDVDLYIYGHTADRPSSGVTYLRIYREKGTAIDPFKLGSVDARSNNRDGDAILAFAKRVRSKTDAQGLLFVLSDGAPSANSYGGRAAIEDTRKKVQKAQSLGFQVIQIAIEESVPSRDMFDYFIKMTDIKNLPRDMVAYMSRKVDKIIRERVTV